MGKALLIVFGYFFIGLIVAIVSVGLMPFSSSAQTLAMVFIGNLFLWPIFLLLKVGAAIVA